RPQAAAEVVIVTGTFTPETETEIDRSISVIEVAQQESLYKNWVDALALSPSVDLRQRAPNDVQGDFSIRGSSFGQTLVLVNGLQMDAAKRPLTDMASPLPPNAVERIEIRRGAGSSLWGLEAWGGPLNVTTATPEHSDFRVGAAVGNFGVNQQSGS